MAVVNYGSETGKLVVISDIVDQNRVRGRLQQQQGLAGITGRPLARAIIERDPGLLPAEGRISAASEATSGQTVHAKR